MSNSTQCVKSPLGASGSCMIRAKLRVFGGTPFHRSSGERFSPSHVYSTGMDAPSEKAVEENARAVRVAGIGPYLRLQCAASDAKQHVLDIRGGTVRAPPKFPKWRGNRLSDDDQGE